jgi:hypothetical protein
MNVKFNILPNSINYFDKPEGLMFSAALYLGWKFIGKVYNKGKGRATYADIAPQYAEALNQAAKDAGYEDLEFYLDSLMNEAEGVTNPASVERALDLYCHSRRKERIEGKDSIEEHSK